jgi:hypothetical protein
MTTTIDDLLKVYKEKTESLYVQQAGILTDGYYL